MRWSPLRAASAVFASVCLLGGAVVCASRASALDLGSGLDFGGTLALTSDYIYRGVSASNGHGAAQADLHIDEDGTYLGVWGSTRDNQLYPYTDEETAV